MNDQLVTIAAQRAKDNIMRRMHNPDWHSNDITAIIATEFGPLVAALDSIQDMRASGDHAQCIQRLEACAETARMVLEKLQEGA